ncbi:MAG TPA: CoA transferase [Gemmatimonas sp.]|nr:CoA transferase [Gemmatimonas sp.]
MGSPDTPAPDAPQSLPLSGVRVVDVGNFLAGPYAASILGEFGAEVLKIEHPIAGDPMRRFGTPSPRADASLKWLSEGRNRKSVTIDLRQPEGVALFLRLLEKSDVLVENFRPGTLEEWGLRPEDIRAANPKLVMLRVSGYGQTGPYRRRSGFAHIAQAFGGLNYLAGFPGETPVLPGTVPLGDYIASLFGAIGVLIALRHSEATGKGQIIDVGIYESVFRVLEEIAAVYGAKGRIREREGSGSFVACPHGHFRTRDDKWIAIACTTDKMFERLSVAMGQPHLSSSSLFGDQRKRLAARDQVNAIVIDWVGARDRDEVLRLCLAEEVPVGKVNSIADIFEDEQFAARGNLARVTEPETGEVVVPGVVPTLSATPGRITNLGPTLGNATDQVLRDLLGLADAELHRLHTNKII